MGVSSGLICDRGSPRFKLLVLTRYLIRLRLAQKGEKTVDFAKQNNWNPSTPIEYVVMNLDDQQSIKAGVADLKSKLDGTSTKIDVLMNNAGVMAIPERTETKDGFEAQFGINHLRYERKQGA